MSALRSPYICPLPFASAARPLSGGDPPDVAAVPALGRCVCNRCMSGSSELPRLALAVRPNGRGDVRLGWLLFLGRDRHLLASLVRRRDCQTVSLSVCVVRYRTAATRPAGRQSHPRQPRTRALAVGEARSRAARDIPSDTLLCPGIANIPWVRSCLAAWHDDCGVQSTASMATEPCLPREAPCVSTLLGRSGEAEAESENGQPRTAFRPGRSMNGAQPLGPAPGLSPAHGLGAPDVLNLHFPVNVTSNCAATLQALLSSFAPVTTDPGPEVGLSCIRGTTALSPARLLGRTACS